jgi:glycerol-3-phosphate dehydrogenase
MSEPPQTPDVANASDCYDLVIIGAGIHGAGVAQAATVNGLKTLVIEKNQPGSGTSSKSSKLIHGGLRYLESAQFRLVRECLRERAILLDIAPHLVKATPFVIPVFKNTTRKSWQVAIGLSLYALLSGNVLAHSNRLSRFRVLRQSDPLLPAGLRRDALRAIYQYWDGQTDDRRLTQAVLASAEAHGATSWCPARFVGAQRNGKGYNVEIDYAGATRTVKTRLLLNAAGPWINEVQQLVQPLPPILPIELVQGTHIEIDVPAPPCCLYVEAPQDRRAVFIMPWRGHTMIGTTESLHRGPADDCRPLPQEVEYLANVYRHYFPATGFNIINEWAGLRVLPTAKSSMFNRTRELTLLPDNASAPTLVAIYGGKLTSYRADSERIVKQLMRHLGRHEQFRSTAKIALPNLD